MFTRILVPLDGSALAEGAIPHAELFARIFGSDIILLQVLDPTSYQEMPNAVDPLRWQLRKAEAEAYMQGIAHRIQKNIVDIPPKGEDTIRRRVEYIIREGKAAENIVDFAHTENIDLLVICTHGSSGLSRWNISSVTQKVINLIYLPVLIVRAFTLPISDESILRYRRILIPIDCSRRAECSLTAGIELARGESPSDSITGAAIEKSTLFLAAVIRPPELPIPEPFPIEISQLTEKLLRLTHQAVDRYLYEMKERLPVNCETCVVESTSVPSAIQQLVEQEDIDILILCAHGYSGNAAWPYGTVTRNYIEHGTKPVLVIQDVPRSQVGPTAAEIAAEKSGRR
ncbi:MAG TPA: universal stress protein [Anaerolineales bacterium]|nr:universal stress protein [Anaerolineales bacterium]